MFNFKAVIQRSHTQQNLFGKVIQNNIVRLFIESLNLFLKGLKVPNVYVSKPRIYRIQNY